MVSALKIIQSFKLTKVQEKVQSELKVKVPKVEESLRSAVYKKDKIS